MFRCILVELLRSKPLFQGTTEVDQIDKIFEVCGTPTEEDWPGVSSLPFFSLLKPKKQYKRCLRTKVTGRFVTEDAIDLLDKLLVLNPKNRLTAAEALAHPYFTNSPLPKLYNLQDLAPCHELQSKELRKKRQKRPDEPNLSPPAKIQKDSQGERSVAAETTQTVPPIEPIPAYPNQPPPGSYYNQDSDQGSYPYPQSNHYDPYAYTQGYYTQAPAHSTHNQTYYSSYPEREHDYYHDRNYYNYEEDHHARNSSSRHGDNRYSGGKHNHKESERYDRKGDWKRDRRSRSKERSRNRGRGHRDH